MARQQIVHTIVEILRSGKSSIGEGITNISRSLVNKNKLQQFGKEGLGVSRKLPIASKFLHQRTVSVGKPWGTPTVEEDADGSR